MPHFTARRFSELVGQIYDCVVEPARWTEVLRELTIEFDGVIATLAVLNMQSRTSRFGAAYGEPEIIEPLVSRYAAEMPFYHLVPKAPIDVPITMPQLCAMYGPNGTEVLYASRLWTEWFVPHRIADAMCTNIITAPDRVAALVINISNDRRSIDHNDIEKLSLITPHIRRAVTISDLFDLQQCKSELFESTLDELQTGVVIVGLDLQILYANREFEKLCTDEEPAVTTRGNRVMFNFPHSQNALENVVAIGLRAEAELGSRGIGLPLPGPVPCVAHILPLANRKLPSMFRQDAAAAIFISRARQGTQFPLDAVAALFGLTAAEQRVAGQISGGMNRQSIASANQVSEGTVKTQLESIFGKTDTSNQRELEKLLHDLAPPFHLG